MKNHATKSSTDAAATNVTGDSVAPADVMAWSAAMASNDRAQLIAVQSVA